MARSLAIPLPKFSIGWANGIIANCGRKQYQIHTYHAWVPKGTILPMDGC
jgi:hypothetical protein